jgi:hypothetical protein
MTPFPGLEPKILKDAKPNEGEGASEDVKKHNEEFHKRADRAHESSDGQEEKVDSKFWSGESLFLSDLCQLVSTTTSCHFVPVPK